LFLQQKKVEKRYREVCIFSSELTLKTKKHAVYYVTYQFFSSYNLFFDDHMQTYLFIL